MCSLTNKTQVEKMRHRHFIIALLLVANTGIINASNSEDSRLTEFEEYEAITESPACKNPTSSSKCDALLLDHYCKFGGSSRNAVRCASGLRNKVEAELNQTYGRLLSALRKHAAEPDSTHKNVPKLLVEAQRAWIKFRDSECTMVAESYNGGTLQPAAYEECMKNEAGQRIKTFKGIADNYGVKL